MTTKPNKVLVQVALDPDDIEIVTKQADALGLSRSALLRLWVLEHVRNLPGILR